MGGRTACRGKIVMGLFSWSKETATAGVGGADPGNKQQRGLRFE